MLLDPLITGFHHQMAQIKQQEMTDIYLSLEDRDEIRAIFSCVCYTNDPNVIILLLFTFSY